jgi:hypothetical protein
MIELRGIDSVSQTTSDNFDYDSIQDMLQGRMEDPFISNELGFTVIAGTEIPNFGLLVDYNPLFLKRFTGQIGYRNDFETNQIFNASIESNLLFNKYPNYYDFKIGYDRFRIENSDLSDYYKLSFGPIYRRTWTSIGSFIGQDTYEKQIGFDIYFKYRFHKLISGSKYEYKSKIEMETLIGYWDKEVIHDYNLNYLINFNYCFGLGYRKHYDFEEVYFTFRYLLSY